MEPIIISVNGYSMMIKEETLRDMVGGLVLPRNNLMSHPLVTPYGRYLGGFHDEWRWDLYALRKAPLTHILAIINLIDKE